MADRRQPFLEFLEENLVVFDGGLGTELYSRGVFINKSFDELNLSNPKLVQDVHRSYVEAGADVIETNTFAANRVKLQAHGLVDQLTAINVEGARIAKASAQNRYVAGAIGPLGIRIEPWGPTSLEEARAVFREQALALAEGGIDLFVLETFSDLPEIGAAIAGVREASGLPILAQMTLEDDGNSLEGVSPEDFASRLDAFGADIIGVNCSVGPHAMLLAVEKMATATTKRLSAQPNAGTPRNVDGRNIYLCSPEYMASYARRFIQSGARIVGGCCGTTPDHIRAIRRSVRSVAASERPRRVVTSKSEASTVTVTPVPWAEKSIFARKLAEKQFAVLVEVLPPKGCDASSVLTSARYLRQSGIDAINIPDGPRASARMTPQALAHIMQSQVGIETIIHYTCRDRNLLGMQSDLLGAHAIGIRNLIVITGDPPKMGDYPDATAVFDVDSVGLVNMVHRLNQGLDLGGNAIGAPTAFHIGVGVNPASLDLDKEVRRFHWKVDAGAEFAVTQPVFDADVLDRFLDRVAHLKVPILAGIWPLASYRNAEFMNNEVPGVVVPPVILARMRKADSKEKARAEGIAIAREMLERAKIRVQGVQLSAPFGRYETAVEVIEGVVRKSTNGRLRLA